MIITLVFITGAPGLYVNEIYHNVEIACKELLLALPKREGVHNAVHYMIDLQKQHLDIVDGMDDIHIVPQKLSKNKSAPKFLLWGVWAHAGKATGGKKCLGLLKNYKNDSHLIKYSFLFYVLVIEINWNF